MGDRRDAMLEREPAPGGGRSIVFRFWLHGLFRGLRKGRERLPRWRQERQATAGRQASRGAEAKARSRGHSHTHDGRPETVRRPAGSGATGRSRVGEEVSRGRGLGVAIDTEAVLEHVVRLAKAGGWQGLIWPVPAPKVQWGDHVPIRHRKLQPPGGNGCLASVHDKKIGHPIDASA